MPEEAVEIHLKAGLLTRGTFPGLPTLSSSTAQWLAEENLPLTVAGPCRIYTGFPNTLSWEDKYSNEWNLSTGLAVDLVENSREVFP